MGVAAALSRDFAAEGRAYVPTLARLLQQALPDEAEPILSGGLLRKSVTGVRLALGDFRYELDSSEKGPVRASKTHVVRGISLKSEPVPVDEWMREVGHALEARMQESARVRSALSELLGLG